MPAGYWARRQDVTVGRSLLKGFLAVPNNPRGIVIVAAGGSGRAYDPQNVRTAAALHSRRFATLLLELLSGDDSLGRRAAFDTDFLCARIAEAIGWADCEPRTAKLPVGLVGSGLCAAAVICAAAQLPDCVSTVVLRDGNFQLAGRDIGRVRAPTLFIVGELDRAGLVGSKKTYDRLTCLKQFESIPGATRAFSEKRGLERMIAAATQWFDLYLIPRSSVAASAAGHRRDAAALR